MGLLKSLLGPNRKDVWRSVASEVGADYVEGGFFAQDKVVAHKGDWQIVLDTFTVSSGKSSQTFTRMSAPYLNAEGFSFRVYRSSIFTPLGKLFGTQDIEVGDPTFDDEFVIQGNDPERLRALFASNEIKRLARMQPAFKLEVSDSEGFFGRDYGPAVDRLQFVVSGVLRDFSLLTSLFELFAAVLDEVCARGSAYQDRYPLPENPLPPGTSSGLQEMWAIVNHQTRDLYGRAERVGDTIEARVVLDRPMELRARIAVSEPVLPADTAALTFIGQVPAAANTRTFEERLREATRRRGKLVQASGGEVTVKISELLRVDVGPTLQAVLDGWRAMVSDAAESGAG